MIALHSAFRWAGRGTLLSAVTVAPWCLGGVYAWTQHWLALAVAAALVFAALAEACVPRQRCRVPLLVWPAVFALGIGVLQIVPFDASVIRRVSPGIASWRDGLQAEDLPEDAALRDALDLPPVSTTQALAAYTPATRHGLALLATAIGAIVGSASLFRSRRDCLLLMAVLGANGCAVALFGTVQKLTWNGAIFWRIPVHHDASNCMGPFVNRNNASGFLLIGLGCLIGWGLYLLSQADPTGLLDPASARRRISLRDRLSTCDTRHLMLAAATAATAGGVLVSLSRGGILSMLAAGLFTAIVLAVSKRRIATTVCLVLALGGGLLLLHWIGWEDRFYERMHTLAGGDMLTAKRNLRLQNWHDAMHAVPGSPVFGYGLLSYPYVYRPFQNIFFPGHFLYAENLYVQMLVDMGILGLAALALGMWLAFRAVLRLVRSADGGFSAIGVGGVFVLVGQGLASCFDFGVYLPGNQLSLCVLIGSLAALSAQDHTESSPPARDQRRLAPRLLKVALPIAAAAACFVAGFELKRVAGAEAARRCAEPVVEAIQRAAEHSYADDVDATDGELAAALHAVEEGIAIRDDDAWLHSRAALLLLEQYRRTGIFAVQDDTGSDTSSQEKGAVQDTGPTALTLFFWSRTYAFYSLEAPLDAWRQDPDIQRFVVPAIRHCVLARRACPLMQLPHILLAQLIGVVAEPEGYERHIRRAVSTYPSDPEVLILSGILHHAWGNGELAVARWRAALLTSSRHLPEVIRLVDPHHTATPELIDRLYPDSIDMLIRLAYHEYSTNTAAREHLLRRAAHLLECDWEGDPARREIRLGRIYRDLDENASATDHLRAAVALEPMNLAWRYEYAIHLRGEGRLDAATDEAKFLLRAEPQNPKYRRLIKILTREARLRETEP